MTSLVSRACGAGFLMLAQALSSSAAFASAADVGRFDFAYVVSGDAPARPVQVFDDGVDKTYFQFHANMPSPVVFTAQGEEMLPMVEEGAYRVVPGRARDFILALGAARARVTHATLSSAPHQGAAGTSGDAPSAAATRAVRMPWDVPVPPRESTRHDARNPAQGSYATPVRGDVIQWTEPEVPTEQAIHFDEGSAQLATHLKPLLARLARRIGMQARVEVIGRDDASLIQDLGDTRAQVLRASLIENGVPPADISVRRADETGGIPAREAMVSSYRKVAVPSSHIRWFSPATSRHTLHLSAAVAADRSGTQVSESSRFVIRRTDAHVEAALRRWARSCGYQLRWDAPVAPVIGELALQARDFPDALSQLVQALRSLGYPLRFVMQGRRTVRIVTTDTAGRSVNP